MSFRYDNRGFDGSVSGEMNLPWVLLEEQTWTQNHVFKNFNLHYSIT